MKYKYRIIKRSDKPYFTLERKLINRFKWLEDITGWEFIDLNENQVHLENVAERRIKEDLQYSKKPEIIIIKEFF